MQRIDGKTLAANVRAQVKNDVETNGLHPKLAVLLVGDDPASQLYVNLKEKACQEVGITTDTRRMPASTSDDELKAIIEDWNRDETVDAILIQVPLPANHDTDAIIATMDPRKDVDGFHPENVDALLLGKATLFPPVHLGILHLIGATDVVIKTAKTAIIANSETFAEPLAHLLRVGGSVVDVFTTETMDVETVKNADIIVVAVGRPQFLTRDLVKSGACIIDVGTNRGRDGNIVGDADAEHMNDIDGWITPVPGGVGPMTVAFLLKNTLDLAKKRRGTL